MIEVLFLVLPDSLLLDLAGPAEAFRLTNQVLQRRGQPPAFRLRYVGPQVSVDSSVGLQLSAIEPLPAVLPDNSWVVLLGRPGDVKSVLARDMPWMQARQWLAQVLGPSMTSLPAARTSRPEGCTTPWRLLTVCVGALLAADAGLVGTRRITTHHELMEGLAEVAPKAHIVQNRVFVEDGPLLSSAGITAGIDLALHCIAQICGEAIAASVAQTLVVFARRTQDAPQRSALLAHRDHLHPAIHRVQDAVCAAPTQTWTQADLADVAHVTPRHLTRLFQQHCGMTPRDYVESVRLAVAEQAAQRGASTQRVVALSGFQSPRQWHRAQARNCSRRPVRASHVVPAPHS